MLKPDPFLVHLDEVPSAGLHSECSLPEGWLASVLPTAYKAASEGTLTLDVMLAEQTLQVTGKIEGLLEFECGRCTKKLQMPLSRHVSVLFVPEAKHKVKVDPEFEEEVPEDLFTYDAHTFSVEAPFVDAIVLSLSPFPICKPDCHGLCLVCGEDLNESTCDCAHAEQETPEALEPLDTPLADAVAMLREKFDRNKRRRP